MLKIFNIYKTYYPDPPGGLQEAIKQICISTKGEVDNYVFTLSKDPVPKIIERYEATVIREQSFFEIASCDLAGLKAFNTFKSCLKNANIVQYHFPWPFGDLLHLLFSNKQKSIVVYHSDIVRQKLFGWLYRPVMMKFLKSMDIIIATSPTYARTSKVLSHSDIKSKVRVIPLAIDEDTYSFKQDTSVYDRISFSMSKPYFVFIGVHRYYKGLDYLINAAKKLKDANVIIAGEGPETERLKSIVNTYKINNVFFTGYITHSEKAALIQNSIALILPSHLRSEAFGMVLVEASMMAKPMISCEIGTGTSFVNLNGKTGFTVPPKDELALLLAMQKLRNNPSLAKEMGMAARERYELMFSKAAISKSYLDLYNQLIS